MMSRITLNLRKDLQRPVPHQTASSAAMEWQSHKLRRQRRIGTAPRGTSMEPLRGHLLVAQSDLEMHVLDISDHRDTQHPDRGTAWEDDV